MRFTKKLFIPILLLFLSVVARAQDEGQAAKEVTSSTNMLAITMIVVAIILAFVVYALGQVLIALSRQVLEKQKAAKNVLPVVMLAGFSLLGNMVHAQDMAEDAAIKIVPNYGGLSGTAFWTLTTVIIVEIIAILFMMSYINRMKTELMPEKIKKPLRLLEWWKRMDKKVFTAAVPVEKEMDIQLDHEYDGIKELDNSLPPWWKWGFIITIFFSAVYLFHFHVFGSGKNPQEEYEAELVQATRQMEAYAAKNKDKVDEDNIVMGDASAIAAGRDIFQQTCWACHGKLGEGGAGPNLTDEYWLHKGSLNDIFHSIKLGYPDKGMQAWEKQYSPKQISDLASFIRSIKGTNPPNAKAPQGEIYTETSLADSATVTTAAADSLKK